MKVISVVGYKKSGKTTLVNSLVRKLSEFGSVGTVKHVREPRFDPETSDTGKHFDAGAAMVMGLTDTELVTISRDPDLEKALDALCDAGLDFAVVEGFKESPLPKIVLGDLEGVEKVLMRLPERPELQEDVTYALIQLILAQPDRFTLDTLIKKVRADPKIREAGAIGTFTGIVRELAADTKTTCLDFEKYEPAATRALEKIRHDLKQREGILEVLIHHKVGRIDPGEDIVYIVIAAAHRTELFPALSDAIDLIKEEAPIWKKEFTLEGDFWVHDMERAEKEKAEAMKKAEEAGKKE
ncbi:MAG: molybdopterin synthase [Methanosarcinaceae archaeon]|nr:molybdopterin synthase [Methanosarcinaceae archaeon]